VYLFNMYNYIFSNYKNVMIPFKYLFPFVLKNFSFEL